MKLPKLVLTDIDGVWTDGGMYYAQNGNEWKKFNTADSAGVLFFQLLKIPVGIITGEQTTIVENRAKKLNINILKMGVKNKLDVVNELAKNMNIKLEDIAYIGDDINDIQVLKSVGVSATPADAPEYVASFAKYRMKKNGGSGVFREFSEFILSECALMDDVIKIYLNSIRSQ